MSEEGSGLRQVTQGARLKPLRLWCTPLRDARRACAGYHLPLPILSVSHRIGVHGRADLSPRRPSNDGWQPVRVRDQVAGQRQDGPGELLSFVRHKALSHVAATAFTRAPAIVAVATQGWGKLKVYSAFSSLPAMRNSAQTRGCLLSDVPAALHGQRELSGASLSRR